MGEETMTLQEALKQVKLGYGDFTEAAEVLATELASVTAERDQRGRDLDRIYGEAARQARELTELTAERDRLRETFKHLESMVSCWGDVTIRRLWIGDVRAWCVGKSDGYDLESVIAAEAARRTG